MDSPASQTYAEPAGPEQTRFDTERKLRDYLREKNELIKAYAGPLGMTPEDVWYAMDRMKRMERFILVSAHCTPDEALDWLAAYEAASPGPR